MKSNKKNIDELLARIKDGISATIAKIRSRKISLPRLSASVFRQTTDKTKILKAKYSNSRLRSGLNRRNETSTIKSSSPQPQISHLTDFIKNIRLKMKSLYTPKFSLSQLSVPDNFRKCFNLKVALAAVLVLVFGAMVAKANTSVNAFAVEVNGKKVAIITEKADAEKLLQNLKAEKARIWKRNVDVQQNLVFKNVKAKRFQIDNMIALKNKLNKNITFVAVATGIKINGRVAVVVKDNQTAEEVLQKLKDSVEVDGIQVESVDFQEKVELAQVPVSLSDLLTTDKAVKLLQEGKQKKVTHVVAEGDSLWSIARRYDMHVADLLKINPVIKGEHLDLGQEINLVATEPMVTVVVTGEQTLKETVPYKVVVESNSDLWRGREKVKTAGKNGLREVSYKVVMKNGNIVSKQVIQEKVLKAATNQVVVRGSKYVAVSRSRGGRVGWPIFGRITSEFGRRWGSMHTGIDIDGYKGEPVGAAAEGVVVSAGWEGGYGKLVVIRHKNGLVTRYGHLSKIEVSPGQSVEKGDLIGLVGSTGRSTGSHLHFEVLSGGNFQNPLKMLK